MLLNHKAFIQRIQCAGLIKFGRVALSGALLCAHWICFFKAIDTGSAAVALLTVATAPIFIMLFNVMSGVAVNWRKDPITCILVILGVFIMMPNTSSAALTPWIYGFLSALLVAGVGFLNKLTVYDFEPAEVAFVQIGICVLLLLGVVSAEEIVTLELNQWGYLAACGILCTAFAQTIFLKSMQTLSALQAAFIVNLEPLYGVLLAILLLGDAVPLEQWIGGSIVLSGVVYSNINVSSLRKQGQTLWLRLSIKRCDQDS